MSTSRTVQCGRQSTSLELPDIVHMKLMGEVTLEDQQAAKLKIAKAERRAKAREIEDRKKPAAPPVPSQPPGRRSR